MATIIRDNTFDGTHHDVLNRQQLLGGGFTNPSFRLNDLPFGVVYFSLHTGSKEEPITFKETVTVSEFDKNLIQLVEDLAKEHAELYTYIKGTPESDGKDFEVRGLRSDILGFMCEYSFICDSNIGEWEMGGDLSVGIVKYYLKFCLEGNHNHAWKQSFVSDLTRLMVRIEDFKRKEHIEQLEELLRNNPLYPVYPVVRKNPFENSTNMRLISVN